MAKVVGIRFKRAGKIYHFSPGDIKTKPGDHVIVETSRGIEYGKIVIGEHEEDDQKVVQPLKEVLRLATEEDIAHEADNKKKEMEAFAVCFDKIRKHGLEMKLIDCEITFDNSKILFYFTADGRIDFRDLVKDLAAIFHTRIELRQEGVRDETKTLGGLGCCGRELCCHSYLSDFVPVSIKMAKAQNLSLNTSKISGVCGRLMCCLKYEENVYEELNRKLPSVGDHATTPEGLRGTVSSVNILKQKIKVLVDLPNDEKEIREYHADEIKFRSRKKGAPRNEFEEAAVEEIEDEFSYYQSSETELDIAESVNTESASSHRASDKSRGKNNGSKGKGDFRKSQRGDRPRPNRAEQSEEQHNEGESFGEQASDNGQRQPKKKHRNRNNHGKRGGSSEQPEINSEN